MFLLEPKNEIENLVRKYNLNQMEYIFLEHYLNLDDSDRESIFNFITDVLADFNESSTALSGPAKIFKSEQLPYAAFKEAPAIGNDQYSDIPDTPEELERKFPPLENREEKEGGLG